MRAAEVVAEVRRRGDAALAEYTERFDGIPSGESLRVGAPRMKQALESLDPDLRASLEVSISNVRAVHEPQRPIDAVIEPVPGIVVERRWAPLRRSPRCPAR